MLRTSLDIHLPDVVKGKISYLLTIARQEIERYSYIRLTHSYWAIVAAEVNRIWDVRVDPHTISGFLMLLLIARRNYLLMLHVESVPMELLVCDLDMYLWAIARREKSGVLNIVSPDAFFDFEIPDEVAAHLYHRARGLSLEMRRFELLATIPESNRLRVCIEAGDMFICRNFAGE
jgi:hypothetical protein